MKTTTRMLAYLSRLERRSLSIAHVNKSTPILSQWSRWFIIGITGLGAIMFSPQTAQATTTSTTSTSTQAVPDTTVNLTIRYQDQIVFNSQVMIPASTTISYHVSGDSTTLTTTTEKRSALSALMQADIASTAFTVSDLIYYSGFSSFFLNCLDIVTSATTTRACADWQYVVNGIYPFVGMDQYALTGGEQIYLYFGQRYNISTNKSAYYTEEIVTGTITEYDYNKGQFVTNTTAVVGWLHSNGKALATSQVDQNGQSAFTPTTTGRYELGLEAGGFYWPKTNLTVSWPVTLTIRHQNQILFTSGIALPTSTTFTYHEANTTTPSTTSTRKASALAAFIQADVATTSFAISDLVYYPAFSSFYLKCVSLATTTPACDNWKYVVNDVHPAVGMDQYDLAVGDNVYIYFGDQYRLMTDKTTYQRGETVTTTLEEYNYAANTFASTTQSGVLALLTSAYSVLATSTLRNQQAVFTPTTTGSFIIGLRGGSEPFVYYLPTTNVTISLATTSSNIVNQSALGNTIINSSSSGCSDCIHNRLNVTQAVQFLNNNQNADGSYGASPLYSDWVAVAFGAYHGENTSQAKLKTYLLTNPAAGTLVTDYERRALALMSLGINPYNGTATNYIKPIVDAFDGRQIGDLNLVNDDTFALLPLLKAGYNTADNIVTSTVAFILSQQQSSGSWLGVDLTAAAIQALTQVASLPGAQSAITKAKTYLQSQQQDDGGFGNLDSTAWAMQAIAALGETEQAWLKNNKTPGDYLNNQQQADGGIRSPTDTLNNRVWSTAYAIPAQLGKPWRTILISFSKPPAIANPNPQTQTNTNTGVDSTGSASKIETGVGGPPPETSTSTPNTPPSTPTAPTSTLSTATSTLTATITSTTATTTKTKPLTDTNKDQESRSNNQPASTVVQPVRRALINTELTNNSQTFNLSPIKADGTSTANQPSSIEPSGEVLALSEGSRPIQKTARGVFGAAITLAGSLGLYLAWRFAQTIV